MIQPGDQLRKIAKKYKVTWQYLARLNRIDPRRIRAGQKLKVIRGPFSAFIDLSDFQLTVHLHGYYVKSYRVGIGKDGATPTGTFTVLNKVVNPQYTDPDGRVIDADDPANPLGERWIDLGDGYGIHGTIEPDSIGRAVSRGCIRMLNDDVAEVYDFLTVGSEVVIQP
ncbi:MAG: L,D-transpeptidase family protein [Planctomycetes bacterium]|nr:L,D-transpeptidase family protein [Planctomycetota bacterium]